MMVTSKHMVSYDHLVFRKGDKRLLSDIKIIHLVKKDDIGSNYLVYDSQRNSYTCCSAVEVGMVRRCREQKHNPILRTRSYHIYLDFHNMYNMVTQNMICYHIFLTINDSIW